MLVSRPQRASLAEADRTSHELATLGIANQQLVINGIMPDNGSDDAYIRARVYEGAQTRWGSAFGEKERAQVEKELALISARVAKSEDYPAAIALVESGQVKLEPLVSNVMPLDEAKAAIGLLGSDSGPRMKIILDHG